MAFPADKLKRYPEFDFEMTEHEYRMRMLWKKLGETQLHPNFNPRGDGPRRTLIDALWPLGLNANLAIQARDDALADNILEITNEGCWDVMTALQSGDHKRYEAAQRKADYLLWVGKNLSYNGRSGPVKIDDPDLLNQLRILEGKDWVPSKGEYGVEHALNHWRELQTLEIDDPRMTTHDVIYGCGGWHRYYVRLNGCVCFSARHGRNKIAAAKAAGFEIFY